MARLIGRQESDQQLPDTSPPRRVPLFDLPQRLRRLARGDAVSAHVHVVELFRAFEVRVDVTTHEVVEVEADEQARRGEGAAPRGASQRPRCGKPTNRSNADSPGDRGVAEVPGPTPFARGADASRVTVTASFNAACPPKR